MKSSSLSQYHWQWPWEDVKHFGQCFQQDAPRQIYIMQEQSVGKFIMSWKNKPNNILHSCWYFIDIDLVVSQCWDTFSKKKIALQIQKGILHSKVYCLLNSLFQISERWKEYMPIKHSAVYCIVSFVVLNFVGNFNQYFLRMPFKWKS